MGASFGLPRIKLCLLKLLCHKKRMAFDITKPRQLRIGKSDEALTEPAMALRAEDRLCLIHEEEQAQDPRTICSRGLSAKQT
jgi:hypothetical protein